MNEEKFTKLLRESMELERKILFPEGEWQSLEQRLEQVDKSAYHWRKWWYILPLLGLCMLCIVQAWQLQGIRADLETIQQKQQEETTKTDTIIKIIEVPKIDTIYKTIIKERPPKTKTISQDTIRTATHKKDLSFLKKMKTKDLNWGEKSVEMVEVKTASRPTNLVVPLQKSSMNSLSFFENQVFVSSIVEKNMFNDWFVQAALSMVKERSSLLNHHVEINQISPLSSVFEEDVHPVFGFSGLAVKDIFSDVSEIGHDLYRADFGAKEWEKRQRNVSAQLDIAYHFPGKTIRPYVGLYAASDWQENVMTSSSQFYQMPSLGGSWNVPPLTDLPPLSSVTFRETTENISTYPPATIKHKQRVQSIAFHQINWWYELNIGLKYTF